MTVMKLPLKCEYDPEVEQCWKTNPNSLSLLVYMALLKSWQSRYWQRNDVNGVIGAMEKMSDHAVIADVVSIMADKIDIVTLDVCTCLLPLLTGLLESNRDMIEREKATKIYRTSLEMLLKLVRIFGSVIYSTLSASSSVVDIEAEQRLDRCNMCFMELEKVQGCLPALMRRGGSIAKSAQELSLALQEVS